MAIRTQLHSQAQSSCFASVYCMREGREMSKQSGSLTTITAFSVGQPSFSSEWAEIPPAWHYRLWRWMTPWKAHYWLYRLL